MSTGTHAGFQQRRLFRRKRRIEQIPPLLIEAEEVRDEVHAIGEVRPIFGPEDRVPAEAPP